MVTIKRFHFLLLIFILFIPDLHAAPYIPIGEIEAQIANSVQIDADGPWRGDQLPQFNRELDERVYLDEYMQILEWQVGMQVDDPGPAFGGQREGELDWNIIQTDNTQEVLRDWAWYARYTGDLERYRENIDASFEYTMNYPAYNEEGGGNPNYYRVHNCGWALVAVMEHIRAYGDSTYLWYGDSCAVYLDSYRLTFNNTFSLNALAAGYGAGALYEYGVWRENQEWIEAAQEIAEDVQAWIESNPNHLSNETWAMSGGTAMWGVVTALFSDDHEAGQEWLPDYVDDLAIYTPEGNWNNSATVWNGHAWAAIYEVLGDQESYDNMLWVTDFLLAQDYEDDDGGIPASEDNYENDQSWTSAYLVWYLLEKLIPPHPPHT